MAAGVKYSERGRIEGYYFHRDFNDMIKVAGYDSSDTSGFMFKYMSNNKGVFMSPLNGLSFCNGNADMTVMTETLVP